MTITLSTFIDHETAVAKQQVEEKSVIGCKLMIWMNVINMSEEDRKRMGWCLADWAHRQLPWRRV